MNATIARTAGPLGRAFGFSLDLGRLHFSVNAGWYVVFAAWRGIGYANLSLDPVHVDWYLQGVSK